MKPILFVCGSTLRVSALAFSVSLALAITGCAGVATLPDTSVTSSAQPGALQGSVFGGHAPITGANVYVLQAGTGGYASASQSLITSTSSGALKDANGNYYVTTAADGSFNVTGDYTCTVYTPVYIAAIAGQTADNIGGSNYSTTPLNITAATATVSGSNYIITFTANNLLYPNQGVVFSGLSNTGGWSALDGGVYYVTTPITTTSFTLSVPTSTGTLTGTTTGSASPQSTNNPAIANLAVLGNCPKTGNFSASGTGSDIIHYVYINEVSTAAAAYALAGFGSGPFNIGYPGGDTLAQTGIENAANNAGQLYNIQGAGPISSTFAGEGHIANSTTPVGGGIVPQATVDTLGNILAACVDSNNYVNSASNPDVTLASTSCSKLFSDATSNGIPYLSTGYGTIPVDTATAAFNIAHNPAASVGSLFSLQGTETTPFAPNLSTAPNDFTLGITYLPEGAAVVTGPESVAVDANGDFWFTTQPTTTTGYLAEASPLGAGLFSNHQTAYTYGDVTIDSAGDAWTGNQNAYVDATEVTPPVSPSTTYTVNGSQGSAFTYAQAAVANGSGDVYFVHGPTNPPPSSTDNDQTLTEVNSSGIVSTGTLGNVSGSFSAGAYANHGAIDNSGALWFTSNNGNLITRVNASTGAPLTGFPFNQASLLSGCGLLSSIAFLSPEQPAIDASGNAWVPVYSALAGTGTGKYVAEISPTGGCTSFTVGTGPWGATVDGANKLWVTNRGGNSLTEINTVTGAVVSPSYTVGGLLSGPEGIAVDLSGDLLITNYTGDSLVEVIGVATPTYLPLGVAASKGKIGAKP